MKKQKKPWPTKAAMTQVYAKQLWGSNDTTFYSGEGSHHPAIVKPYVDAVSSFLKLFTESLTVLDLGCGDFNIGRQLAPFTKTYTGIDIVAPLIAYNTATYAHDYIQFECLDISKDELPKADCVILRQVLQHLSNAEILNILQKVTKYKYVIITEHIPAHNFTPNIDIIAGQGTRLKKGSGVEVMAEPFNFKSLSIQELSVVTLPDGKGIINTLLYTMFI